jgi:hypothetical protein
MGAESSAVYDWENLSVCANFTYSVALHPTVPIASKPASIRVFLAFYQIG